MPTTTPRPDPRLEEIEQAEDARYQAMIARDLEALGRILADEFHYHRANGKDSRKDEFLEDLAQGGARFIRAERHGVSVHFYGDTATAMGSARVEVEVKGQTIVQLSRYLNVWVRRDGRWQLAARQGANTGG